MDGKSNAIDYAGFVQQNNFYATFGNEIISFSRVTNLESQAGYDVIPEGGLNDRVHVVYRPNTQINTATFEKAIHKNDLFNYDKIIRVGASFETVNIFVTDGQTPQKLYVLMDCFVAKKSISGLDASNAGLLTSRMELVYSNMSEEEV